MSAPEVGDRVRVHGEPFRGGSGYVPTHGVHAALATTGEGQ